MIARPGLAQWTSLCYCIDNVEVKSSPEQKVQKVTRKTIKENKETFNRVV
jgi:hypothetical protein